MAVYDQSPVSNDRRSTPSADTWFSGGRRVGYDARQKRVLSDAAAPLQVFVRQEGDPDASVTFMGGFPDGSYGWSHVLPFLPDADTMGKLFIEYMGQGDSDKPKSYKYGTRERADLVESHWRHSGVTVTSLVAFDYSSLVVMELLVRFLERKAKGDLSGPVIQRIVIANGGLFTDGHSHPWFTTPFLRGPLGPLATYFGQRFRFVFDQMVASLWSKGYHVQPAEIDQVFNAIGRRHGVGFVSQGAGFVAEHIAEGERWDFGRLYRAVRSEIPILIIGSAEDPFEHKQIPLARARLDTLGLWSRVLPGGHFITSEQPATFGALIGDFLQGQIR